MTADQKGKPQTLGKRISKENDQTSYIMHIESKQKSLDESD